MSGTAHNRRFSPGEWYAVSGEAATLVLPPTASTRVAALWELADRGASADELLEAVLAEGFRSLSDLVLLSESQDAIRVLVRGTATVVVSTPDSEVTVAAVPGTIWNEQLVAGATTARVRVNGGHALAGTPLHPGIARISVLEVGAVTDIPCARVDAGADVGADAVEVPLPDVGLREDEESLPSLPLLEAPLPDLGESTDLEDPIDVEESPTDVEESPTLDQVPAAEAPPVAEPAVEAPDLEAPQAEAPEVPANDSHTQVENPSFDQEWSDRDGHTRVTAPQEFTRPPIPGQEMAPAVVSRPVAKLVFSTGDVVDVDRVVLAGRAPEARRFASHDQPRLLTLPSPNQEISSTHLEVRPGAGADHGMAIVTDLGSTNGTVLMQPGLPPEDLRPGIAVSLVPGAVLDLGDGVTIQVTNP